MTSSEFLAWRTSRKDLTRVQPLPSPARPPARSGADVDYMPWDALAPMSLYDHMRWPAPAADKVGRLAPLHRTVPLEPDARTFAAGQHRLVSWRTTGQNNHIIEVPIVRTVEVVREVEKIVKVPVVRTVTVEKRVEAPRAPQAMPRERIVERVVERVVYVPVRPLVDVVVVKRVERRSPARCCGCCARCSLCCPLLCAVPSVCYQIFGCWCTPPR